MVGDSDEADGSSSPANQRFMGCSKSSFAHKVGERMIQQPEVDNNQPGDEPSDILKPGHNNSMDSEHSPYRPAYPQPTAASTLGGVRSCRQAAGNGFQADTYAPSNSEALAASLLLLLVLLHPSTCS